MSNSTLCIPFCCLLVFAVLGVWSPQAADAEQPMTAEQDVMLEEQATTQTMAPDPDYSEEEIRRARNRFSIQVFFASAVLGTIVVVSVALWAQRKRRERLADADQAP